MIRFDPIFYAVERAEDQEVIAGRLERLSHTLKANPTDGSGKLSVDVWDTGSGLDVYPLEQIESWQISPEKSVPEGEYAVVYSFIRGQDFLRVDFLDEENKRFTSFRFHCGSAKEEGSQYYLPRGSSGGTTPSFF